MDFEKRVSLLSHFAPAGIRSLSRCEDALYKIIAISGGRTLSV
jgi:hypothetical protein